jgi:hypothetical protein
LHERFESRIAAEWGKHGIDFDYADIVAVAFGVALFQGRKRLIFLAEAYI